MLTPASLGLALTALPAERVSNGVRLWAVSTALAGAAGPVAGGLLTEASWRWIFVINIPLGLANATARQLGAVLATAVTVVILGRPSAEAARPRHRALTMPSALSSPTSSTPDKKGITFHD